MQLEIVRSFEALDGLAAEWNDLLKVSASHVPFLRYEYLRTWWQTLGGGEWQDGELYIICARDDQGGLIGVAPLFFTLNREGEPALLLIGSVEISDYLDVISRQEDRGAFIAALLDLLGQETALPWKALDLFNVLETSPTLPALEEAARRCGWEYREERLQHCPYIPLPGDWETYLAGIDKKQRHEVRRKLRRAESADEPVRWYFVTEEAQLDRAIEDFLALMAQDEEKGRFLTEPMRRQMHLLAEAAFQAGWLQLSFLEVAGERAAGYLTFDFDNQIWVYNSGLSQSHRELSPGWVLLGYLLKWANESGREVFDFMRGDEEYKYRFGAIDRHIKRVQVRRG